MSRNLVVCCDGTANEFAPDRTNVVKLYTVLDHDPQIQCAYYHPGLGTMEPAGALTPFTRRLTKGLGLAFGYGLADDVRDAYVFLMQHYAPGDDIFLFGFSRGAYTVRAVAAMLHLYGLVRAGNERLVPYAIRMMLGLERSAAAGRDRASVQQYFQLAGEFKQAMTPGECRVRFVGVWDTVSSVGWVENPLKLPFVTNTPSIDVGRHAIAIDERRAFFRSHRWAPAARGPSGPRDLKQVWFAGVHADVGGGYPEAESGLAKHALEWMLCEAVTHGLRVNPARVDEVLGRSPGSRYVPPDADGPLHESLGGWWHVAEFVPKKRFDAATGRTRRRPSLYRRRVIPPGSLVHDSVFHRANGAYAADRLPPEVERVSNAGPCAGSPLPGDEPDPRQ